MASSTLWHPPVSGWLLGWLAALVPCVAWLAYPVQPTCSCLPLPRTRPWVPSCFLVCHAFLLPVPPPDCHPPAARCCLVSGPSWGDAKLSAEGSQMYYRMPAGTTAEDNFFTQRTPWGGGMPATLAPAVASGSSSGTSAGPQITAAAPTVPSAAACNQTACADVQPPGGWTCAQQVGTPFFRPSLPAAHCRPLTMPDHLQRAEEALGSCKCCQGGSSVPTAAAHTSAHACALLLCPACASPPPAVQVGQVLGVLDGTILRGHLQPVPLLLLHL